MRVVHLSTEDTVGGASRAAFRLHRSLHERGVDSRMVVAFKHGGDPAVSGPRTKLGKSLGSVRWTLDGLPVRLYPKWRSGMFSPAYLPDTVPGRVAALKPDLTHLHLTTAGFMRVESFPSLSPPLVWTLHDMWAFTGGCHYSGGCTRYARSCGRCPELGSRLSWDLSRLTWYRKARAWRRLRPTIVAPSRWLGACARTSSLFHTLRVEVIPNGIDTRQYQPVDKQVARQLLGLPQTRRLVLFGATGGLGNRRKGMHLLQPALLRLSQRGGDEEIGLVVLGASQSFAQPNLGFPTHMLGDLRDDVALVLAYAAADLFVAPSIEDNLPNTVMEALACGRPCVAFAIGGMPDLIEHERTGYLAQPFDTDDLAHGIAWVLANEERYQALCQQARRKVEVEFEQAIIAGRYEALYHDVLRQYYSCS